jgi:phosphoribosyl 1,2-cyclic phosphodiesterase
LNNFDIALYAKRLKIPFFRGVYMRDTLPKTGPLENESAIVNLDTSTGTGTHWVCYMKIGSVVEYYDSFAIPPPYEVQVYLQGIHNTVLFNYEQDQRTNQVICGHLCLKFLSKYAKKL